MRRSWVVVGVGHAGINSRTLEEKEKKSLRYARRAWLRRVQHVAAKIYLRPLCRATKAPVEKAINGCIVWLPFAVWRSFIRRILSLWNWSGKMTQCFSQRRSDRVLLYRYVLLSEMYTTHLISMKTLCFRLKIICCRIPRRCRYWYLDVALYELCGFRVKYYCHWPLRNCLPCPFRRRRFRLNSHHVRVV